MKKITFNIHRGDGFVSKAIMKLSHGNFSHVSFKIGRNYYEAVEGEGVVNKRVSTSPIIERYTIEVSNKKAKVLEDWVKGQVGKKYDWTGVFAHVFPIFLRPKIGYWYCSEIAFVLTFKAKDILGDDISSQKVSPQMFRDILKLLI